MGSGSSWPESQPVAHLTAHVRRGASLPSTARDRPLLCSQQLLVEHGRNPERRPGTPFISGKWRRSGRCRVRCRDARRAPHRLLCSRELWGLWGGCGGDEAQRPGNLVRPHRLLCSRELWVRGCCGGGEGAQRPGNLVTPHLLLCSRELWVDGDPCLVRDARPAATAAPKEPAAGRSAPERRPYDGERSSGVGARVGQARPYACRRRS
jgi:hypothetical protein